MNGIMVPLLILVMTGNVIGQQTNSSQFTTGGNQSSSVFNDGGSPSNPPGQYARSQIKPFDLFVDQNAIDGLRNQPGAVLRSRIEAIDPNTNQALDLAVINAITLSHKRNENMGVQKSRIIIGESDGQGGLLFGLNDADLNSLADTKLSFEFSESDRGQFQTASFYYIEPQSTGIQVRDNNSNVNAQTGFSPSPDETPSDRFNQTNFPSITDRNNSALPSPGPEPGEQDFVGPVLPTNFNAQPMAPIRSPNSFDSWNATRNASNTNPAFQPSTQDSTSFPVNSNNNGFGTVDLNQMRLKNQQEANTRYQEQARRDQIARDKAQARQADLKWRQDQEDRQAQRDEIARLNRNSSQGGLDQSVWQNPNATRTPAPTGTLNQGNSRLAPLNNFRLTQQEIDERQELIDLAAKIDSAEEFLRLQKRDIALREARLKREQDNFDQQKYLESLKTQDVHDIAPKNYIPSSSVAGNRTVPTQNYPNMPDRFASKETSGAFTRPTDSLRFINPSSAEFAKRIRNAVRLSSSSFPELSESEFAARLAKVPNKLTNPSGMIDRLDADYEANITAVAIDLINDVLNSELGIIPTLNDTMGASINGPSNAAGRNNKSTIGSSKLIASDATDPAVKFTYLMLLCSLGMNVYLVIISRGFYVRYQELADELRDTFSTTM
jgi:hypothetical protein